MQLLWRAGTLVLAAAVVTVSAEILPVEHHDPCPRPGLPAVACFGSVASQTARWGHRAGVGEELALTTTLEYVRSLLQSTIEVEHSTIPLYLTTGYSIRNQSSFEAMTMQSVVMEEMLHMVNAANVLNAIGGAPSLDHPDFIPKYPLVIPFLNMSADVVWFTRESIQHYQTLESTPPGGYNTSISAAYLQITNLLTELVRQHGEAAVFSGNRSLQVQATTSYGQMASKVFTLEDATAALLGVADQGGGCPITGKPWPETSNISAGPLGGGLSHAARYEEIVMARSYLPNDVSGQPTGPKQAINWTDVLRFAPNPAITDFDPAQCVAGGSWVVRNSSFFVKQVWDDHNHRLAVSNESSWQDCAKKCEMWTVDFNQPLAPCAMWTWRNAANTTIDGVVVPAHQCLLAQGGGPITEPLPGFVSGCQYGTVCNQSLPGTNTTGSKGAGAGVLAALAGGRSGRGPAPGLAKQCAAIQKRAAAFAESYTALLVSLHNVFNGNPDGLGDTIGAMYALKGEAIALMETPDPRIHGTTWTMGIGPPWEYVKSASQYEARGGRARPMASQP